MEWFVIQEMCHSSHSYATFRIYSDHSLALSSIPSSQRIKGRRFLDLNLYLQHILLAKPLTSGRHHKSTHLNLFVLVIFFNFVVPNIISGILERLQCKLVLDSISVIFERIQCRLVLGGISDFV
jgi:hypothetical protein